MSPSKAATVDFTKFCNIVDGQQRGSEITHQGIDPTTGEALWGVPVATQQDVDDAVRSAKKAFKSWSQTPIETRQGLMLKYAGLCDEYQTEMHELLSKECGKPKWNADVEIHGYVAYLRWHAGLELPEDRLEDDDKIITTRYTPLGVVGAICPWNYPLVLSMGKIAPALLSGCCIIVKPSPFTPYSSLKAVELAQQILPPGVMQVVGGDDKLGPMLTNHPDIQMITFTGSTATGKKIMEACAKTLKRVTLELGGNDASIICEDVDVDIVAPHVAMGAFQNSGQVCVATKRIYVHEKIYNRFVAKMVEYTKSLKVGSKTEDIMLGPVQNLMQYQRVKTFLEDSKKHGYKFAVGEPDVVDGKGYFIQPTIIDNPPSDSRIVQEEPFGPIVPVQPWSDEEEVIERANNVDTGLGACVWAKDLERAHRIGRRLEAGSVWINSFEKPSPQAFFSGHKESGIGGEWGTLGVLAYCNVQVTHTYKQIAFRK